MYISRGELWGGPIRQSLKIAAPRKYRFPESSNTQRRGAVGWQSWPGAAPRPQSWFPRLRVVATVNVDDVRHMGGTGRSCRRREVGKETELLPLRDPDPDPPFVTPYNPSPFCCLVLQHVLMMTMSSVAGDVGTRLPLPANLLNHPAPASCASACRDLLRPATLSRQALPELPLASWQSLRSDQSTCACTPLSR
jgi:hypothetical protein